jgi:hypothetical protein
MPLGKEVSEFSSKVTSVTYRDTSGQANVHGTATGFGTVQGTLSFTGQPNAKSGTNSWRGTAYLDNGETLNAAGEGTWEESGKHKWHVRMLLRGSDGQSFFSDGEVDLAGQSYNGKLYEC